MNQVTVIGISDAGLEAAAPQARAALASATLVAGGVRHLSFCNGLSAEKFILKGNLKELVARLEGELAKPEGRPVVLASGDPLFFGVGKYLAEKLGRERLRFQSGLSSMQQAFAKAGLSWEDAVLVSVHGRSLDELARLRSAAKAGVFTDHPNHPGVVARYLLDLGWPSGSPCWVAEDLEGPDEALKPYTLEALAKHEDAKAFHDLNVVLAERADLPPPAELHAFGLPDEAFAQRKPDKGLITKAEVRVLSLSKLRAFPGCVAWDLGAATGSVAVELARLGAKRVWAVEKNAEDCENVKENIARFHVPQVKVLHGSAPEALAGIPEAEDPDCVFVGGTAGKMSAILDACLARLKPGGSLVLNTVTLENTAQALEWFKASTLDWGFLQVQVSRGKPVLELQRLEALNPVFLFWGHR